MTRHARRLSSACVSTSNKIWTEQIWDRLNREREAAIEEFVENWEDRRGEELEEVLTDAFEDGLNDAIEDELEKLPA
jgi:hypothetical protein